MTVIANRTLARTDASKSARRRRQLLDAAIRVMKRTGYHEMSMQALADEAGVSVGLAYRYFSNKEDVLLAAILAILDALGTDLGSTVTDDLSAPDQLRAVFTAYVRVIDRYRESVLLTYRESATLSPEGQAQIKELEVATAAPMADAIRQGIADGTLVECDVDLVVYDLVLIAHGWALKHWYFAEQHTVDSFVDHQADLVLRALRTIDSEARS